MLPDQWRQGTEIRGSEFFGPFAGITRVQEYNGYVTSSALCCGLTSGKRRIGSPRPVH